MPKGIKDGHALTLVTAKRHGRTVYQAVCDCGEAGYYRQSEYEAESDYTHHQRTGRWRL